MAANVAGSDSESNDEKIVTLGFVTKVDDPGDEFLPQKFPSKVGGKPVWLNPEKKPPAELVKCEHCGELLAFLLQVFAPLRESFDPPAVYYRTIYVLSCVNANCLRTGNKFRVLRSQLDKENSYYREDTCGNSQLLVAYQHSDSDTIVDSYPEFLLEDELEPETEADEIDGVGSVVPSTFFQRMKRLNIKDLPMVVEDKTFMKAQQRMALAPDQVFRYYGWDDAEPLWVGRQNQPCLSDIPTCPLCSSERHFEFQIMSQLLYFLGPEDQKQSLKDSGVNTWSTLAIYTCPNHCFDSQVGYQEEFLWCQQECLEQKVVRASLS